MARLRGWTWVDNAIVYTALLLALLAGWGARGWVEGYKAWLDTPIVTIEQEGPKDVSVCVSREFLPCGISPGSITRTSTPG